MAITIRLYVTKYAEAYLLTGEVKIVYPDICGTESTEMVPICKIRSNRVTMVYENLI